MWIMPQIALQKVLQVGLREIKSNPEIIDEIFSYMSEDDLSADYGSNYVAQIKEWFVSTKIPVLHAWSFNADRIPCIAIHLANESEDESKASMGDYLGIDSDSNEIGVGATTTQLDIGIHASKSSDQVLWLYYIVSYVLFKQKRFAEQLGMQIHTFTASDWDRRQEYSAENIWTRWIRFRCTTQNTWTAVEAREEAFDTIETDVDAESATTDFDEVEAMIVDLDE